MPQEVTVNALANQMGKETKQQARWIGLVALSLIFAASPFVELQGQKKNERASLENKRQEDRTEGRSVGNMIS